MPISSRPDDTRALLAFLRAPQVGAARLAAVIAHHGSPLAALRSGERGWRLAGLPAEAVAWLRAPDTRRLEADLAWLAEPDHHLLAHADPRYPERLRQLADAPPGLFLCGDPEWLSLPMLSMVI